MDKNEFNNSIANINNTFNASKDKIGATNTLWKLLPAELASIFGKFAKGEPISKVELKKLKNEWTSKDPLIDENGNPFVLYIHDFNTFYRKPTNRVFHVAWCSTLDTMEKNGRKARYVKKSDLGNNNFDVDYGGERKGVAQLPACYNCQKKMRYIVAPENLYYSRDNLDIVKFFKMYGKQDLIDMGNSKYSVDYPKDWRKISRDLREQEDWKCSECDKDFVNNKHYLQVHHKDGVKSNIKPNNLQVLCKDCHERQPFHSHMKNSHIFNNTAEVYQREIKSL